MRSQCISRDMMTWSLPTIGMLFSLWQAMMHDVQPRHVVMSIAMPQACGSLYAVGGSQPSTSL